MGGKMSSDVVSQTVKVNVRFRGWTAEDIKHNNEPEYELLTKRPIKGIDFVVQDGYLIINKIKAGVNFDAQFVDFPRHLVMNRGDRLKLVDGKDCNPKAV